MSPAVPTPEEIREVVRGARRTSLSRGEAFALLARSDAPEREALLADVVQDEEERPSTRAGAATALGRIQTPTAEALLVDATRVQEPHVLDAALRALGRIGTPPALGVLDGLQLPAGHPAVLAAEFAAVLISHRFGLDGHDQAMPGPDQVLTTTIPDIEMDVRRPSADQATDVLAGLREHPHGIEFDQASMLELRCFDRVNVVCLNRDLTSPGSAAQLVMRKMLAGLVAVRSGESGRYAVSDVILSVPRGATDAVGLVLRRDTGPVAMVGSGVLAGSMVRFSLQATKRPGAAAMMLEGTLTDGRLEVDVARYSREREPKLRPRLARLL